MRTLRVTVISLGIVRKDGWGERHGWTTVIRDADTDEVIHETTWMGSHNDNGEGAEREARGWIQRQMGSAPRSFDVPIPDGIGWDWTTQVREQPPEEPTVRERLERVEAMLWGTSGLTVLDRLKRIEGAQQA